MLKLVPISLFFLLCSSCSDLPQVELDNFFQSPDFINIYIPVIKENFPQNSVLDKYSQNIVRGFFDKEKLYRCNLDRQLSQGNDRFYAFLKKHGYMTLHEYPRPYERRHVPGVIFAKYVEAFHKYSAEFEASLINNGRGLYRLIGRREFDKITYRKKYKKNISGVETTVISIIFQYSIKPTFPQIAKSKKVFEGKLNFLYDPNDGRWKLASKSLNDNGSSEIITLLPKESLKKYFSDKKNELQREIKNQRMIDVERSDRIEMTIKVLDNKEYGGFFTFIGLVSSDYAVKVEPVSGKYSKVRFFLADSVKKFPQKHKIGDIIKTGGMGGNGYWWSQSGPLLFDLQEKLHGQSEVTARSLAIKIFGEVGASAKVTIYHVDKDITPQLLVSKGNYRY